jgi:hypothetical protein
MAKTEMPECKHCFGKNWNKIALLNEHGLYLWICGHGPAHAEEMTNGCSRVIAATEAEMSQGGII